MTPGVRPARSVVYLLVVGWALVPPAAASAQLAAYPVNMTLEASASPTTTAFTVENDGSSMLEVSVYLGDYDRTPDGAHAYLPFGEHERSCGGRLHAFPDQLGIPAGGRAEVQVRLDAGAGTCWGMVFVEHRSTSPSGLTVAQRIAVKVVGQPGGLPRAGAVLAMAADTAAGLAVRIAFENQGEGALRPWGEVEVRGMDGDVVGVAQIPPFQVLPGRRRIVRIPLNDLGLPPGRYVAVGIVDFDGPYLAGGQAMVEVRP